MKTWKDYDIDQVLPTNQQTDWPTDWQTNQVDKPGNGPTRQADPQLSKKATKPFLNNYVSANTVNINIIFLHLTVNHRACERKKHAMTSRIYKDATSKTDLCNILSNCAICYRSTENGNFIISHTELPRILLNRREFKKREFVNLIVNTKCVQSIHNQTSSPQESPPDLIGHWFLISVSLITTHPNHPKAVVSDPLNEITRNTDVMANIRMFCDHNSLKLYDLDAKHQSDSSTRCGYLICGLIAYIHKNKKLNKLLALKKMFLRNSVRTNEEMVLKLYKNHFVASGLPPSNIL